MDSLHWQGGFRRIKRGLSQDRNTDSYAENLCMGLDVRRCDGILLLRRILNPTDIDAINPIYASSAVAIKGCDFGSIHIAC